MNRHTLRAKRLELGLSQVQLGNLCVIPITANVICHYEAGTRTIGHGAAARLREAFVAAEQQAAASGRDIPSPVPNQE